MKLILILLTVCVLALCGFSASEIIILKCCKNNEELSTLGDSTAEPKCVPSEKVWKPFVYSPSRQSVVPRPKEWIIQEAKKPQCRENYILTFVPCTRISPCIFFDDGNVTLDIESRAHLTPVEYCADSKAFLVCMIKKAITVRPKVYKCCGGSAIFHEAGKTCVHQKDLDNTPPLLSNTSLDFDLLGGFPRCRQSDNITIIGESKASFLQSDGGLEVNGILLPPSQFCVERIKELNGQELQTKIIACPEYAPHRGAHQETDIRFFIYPICIIISAIFLAATLATGCLLPASHHVLHWRCQTHHVVCLMLGDLFMAFIQLASSSVTSSICKPIAILAHFFFLSSFFWLNTMCFNIWWTFRDLRPASLEKGQEAVRLRVYACYAWGGPLLIAGLAALLDYLPTQPHYVFLRPRFGEKKCWFYGDTEILAYFYGPIAVLLTINILFFIATARELTCGLWKGEFVKSTTERAALGRVCLKLVIVMGVTWIADVISWAVGGPQYLWYFTDILNALQGLFIFIVVGWQPQVRASLKRLCNKNPRTDARRQGNGLSTTSHGMPSIGDSVTQNPSTKTVPMETIC